MTIKLNQPAQLSDFELGGGPMLRQEVDPAVSGSLLPKLSRRARAGGEVALREVFTAYETADDAALLGAGLAITEPPAADGVDVVLFAVPDRTWTYRSEAVAHLEAYTVAGQEMDWRVFGDHLAGVSTVRLWAPPDSPMPGIGDAVYLTDERIGQTWQQAFRILSLTATDELWVAAGSNPIPYIDLLLTLSDRLTQDVDGQSAPAWELVPHDYKIRKGQVSGDAKFYGVSVLAEDVVADVTTEVKVDSVFAPVVPASRSTTSIIDVPVLARRTRTLASGVGQTYTDISSPAHSDSTLITSANRSKNYTVVLTPKPAIGSVAFSYVALGEWYTLSDNSDGTIGGAGLGGSGTYVEATGTLAVTLEYSPDLDTYLVWNWGSYQQWTRIDGQVIAPVRVEAILFAGSEPGTLAVSWTAGGVAKTATDDGAGALIGDATGSYHYGDGLLSLAPNVLPDGDIEWSVADGPVSVTVDVSSTLVVSGGRVTFTVATALPIAPGSASVSLPMDHRFPDGFEAPGWGNPYDYGWFDQGDGTLKGPFVSTMSGTIDYATGAYDLPEVVANHTTALRWDGGGWVAQQVSTYYAPGGPVTVAHSAVGAGGVNTITGTLTAGDYGLTLILETVDPVEYAALIFRLGGDTYRGLRGGEITRDGGGLGVNGAPAVVGTGSPGGVMTLTDWVPGGGNGPNMVAGLTRGGEWTATEIHWRAAGTGIQPASLGVVGTSAEGDAKAATTDASGLFSGDATGQAKFTEGFVNMTWLVAMDPATLTHSAVIVQLIPLDKDIIGIDAAKLPSDGQVVIYNAGGQVAVGDSVTETLPNLLSPGQVVALSQTGLNTVSLTDQDGALVDPALYTVDLDTGILTMADPLDLSGYNESLVAKLCWDDQATVVDVQANGIITLANALPRAYAAATARVYAILDFGTLRAHVAGRFDQKVWDGVFRDDLNGDTAPFTYNFAGFPVEVDNDQAPTERWALHFVSSTTVEVIGETLGNLGQFAIAIDMAPVDPATGLTVWTLRSAGWGGGQVPGNVLRIDIAAAAAHAWVLRCTSMGAESLESDQVTLNPRGDI